MDESLSDFQEPKINLKSKYFEPKLTKPIKTRQNRKPKPKGQQDIRNILKAKKKDLIKYTEDFNFVCQQSGLDVDSEQLQIAIALSKSEQVQLEDNSSESLSFESLNSQERKKKIRTTLLEYGFKVPEVKTNFNVNKKGRKLKKDSKLLNITDEGRQQKISIKYAKVLFNNLSSTKYNKEIYNEIYPDIYSKATHVKYESLKNDSFFMVDNLFEKSASCIGNLLKDWSKIPGRPQSPCLSIKTLSFSDLILSDTELDVLLSGTFSSVNKILADKQYLAIEMASSLLQNKCKEINSPDINVQLTNSNEIRNTIIPKIKLAVEKSINYPLSSSAVQHRSCSPDIFEDESLSAVQNTSMTLDHSKYIEIVEKENMKILQSKNESADIFILPCSQKSSNCLTVDNSKENVTKRLSNDFMDLTECVVENPLAKTDVDHDRKKDEITQDSRDNDILELDCNFSLKKHNVYQKNDDYMGITECVNLSCPVKTENCIKKTKNLILSLPQNISTEYIDLTENCYYSHNVKNSTIIYACDSPNNDISTIDKTKYIRDLLKLPHVETDNKHDTIEHIDLTQEYRPSSPADTNANNFDSFVYNNTDNNNKDIDIAKMYIGNCSNKLNKGNRNENFPTALRVENKDVVNIENAFIPIRRKNSEVSCLSHNKNEVNFINNKFTAYNGLFIGETSSSSKFNTLGLNSQESTSSQSSQIVFEISDEELDYSIHECKFENFLSSNKVLGICGDNHLTQYNSSHNNITEKKRTSTLNRSLSDSCLPLVEIKGINVRSKSSSLRNNDKPKSLNSTPVKTPQKDVVDSSKKIETPKNSNYIIKTSEVTPILDYEKLTTPERIKELDKYGLKPFKRKRAIQILKHLYNQTHPFMENLSDDNPSLSKKRKTNASQLKNKSSNQQICNHFPIRKCTLNKAEKENVFAVTNNIPVIKEVYCHPDDWVFQKREKAKVHTCRVPLHIAFHNYVSSRYALQEAILQYQPIDIDIIHKELTEYGHKYDPKDLLRFLDKKCITVKTTDNMKNKRR